MMDWTVKTPSLWDWDNQLPFDGSFKLLGNGGGDGGGGASSGSEVEHVSSSKSSVSASTDSSSKVGKEPSVFNFEAFPDKNKCLQAAGVGSEESLISLKLGKRSYFGEVNMESDSKKNVSSAALVTASPALLKKARASQSLQSVCCQIEGCDADLSAAKDYHRKHRVCEMHTKFPRVIVDGQERRFCQQCSRFHDLSEFDQKKRSCRKRLSDHNARRRKPQPEIISLNSSSFSLSPYDEKHMNFLWNQRPTGNMRPYANSTWDSYNFKLPSLAGRSTTKAEGFAGQLHAPNIQLPNDFCYVDNLMPLKGTTAEVLDQGSEASVEASSIGGAPALRRALSLLSTSSWVSPDSEHTSLLQLPDTDNAFMYSVNSASHHRHIAPSLDQQTRVLSFAMQNAGSPLHKYQLQKEPYGTPPFHSNQIN